MAKELLREFYELFPENTDISLLTEEERAFVKDGGVMLSGVMQRSNTKNGNGRVYGRDILEREISNYGAIIEDRRALGELDHPDDSVINLKNVSHMVTKIWWDGDNVMGKVRVLDTPSGNILKSLIRSGVKLGISSRGLGSTRREGGNTIVEDDFQLICFDFVQEPSTPGAFMVKENKNRDFNQILSKNDKLSRLLSDITKD